MKIKWSGKRTLVTAALAVGVLWLYAMGSEKRRRRRCGRLRHLDQHRAVPHRGDRRRPQHPLAPALDPGNVVGELNRGDQANAVKVVQNGFRKLAEGRWVSDEYAKPVDGSNC